MGTLHLDSGLSLSTSPPLSGVSAYSLDEEKSSKSARGRAKPDRLAPDILVPRRLRYVEPELVERKSRRLRIPSLKVGHGVQSTASWSGIVSDSDQEAKFVRVAGSWTIPTVTAPLGAQANDHFCASSWIGLDGDDGSTDVLQAGCDAEVNLSNGAASFQYRLWIEWYPSGTVWVTNIPVSPGDFIQCQISLNPGSSTEAMITLANLSTGVGGTPIAVNAGPGCSSSGNCAEWIVEAFGSLGTLANYSSVTFSSCSASSASGVTSDLEAANVVNMLDPTGTLLSTGAVVDPSTVRVSYV